MDTGMLWFDDGPQGLKDKVARAVSFYATKYGRTPTRLPGPSGDDRPAPKWGRFRAWSLRETHAILPNHFLVGIEECRRASPNPSEARKARPAEAPERSRGTGRRAGRRPEAGMWPNGAVDGWSSWGWPVRARPSPAISPPGERAW